MKHLKVVKISADSLEFDNGIVLSSDHEQSCCEHHYLCLKDLSLDDFEGLYFDLSDDSFFDRIEDYGISLKPVNGFPIRIPGYGSNNGYYSSNLSLTLNGPDGFNRSYDITECQEIE